MSKHLGRCLAVIIKASCCAGFDIRPGCSVCGPLDQVVSHCCRWATDLHRLHLGSGGSESKALIEPPCGTNGRRSLIEYIRMQPTQLPTLCRSLLPSLLQLASMGMPSHTTTSPTAECATTPMEEQSLRSPRRSTLAQSQLFYIMEYTEKRFRCERIKLAHD